MKKVLRKRLLSKGYLILDFSSDESFDSKLNIGLIRMINCSFESLGFKIKDEELIKLLSISIENLTAFYHNNYALLSSFVGNSVKHKIFYANFPEVSNIPEEEMNARAQLHYLTASENDDGFMSQDINDFKREEVHTDDKTVLRLINEKEANKILIDLVKDMFESKQAISCDEKNFILSCFRNLFDKESLYALIDNIPFKENIAIYVNTIRKLYPNKTKLGDIFNEKTLAFVKTPTDLLRVYAIVSNGDYTLNENSKFISLDRKCRKLFLAMLNNMCANKDSIYDDFSRHVFLWKKAFEKLHVGEYEKQYPHIYLVCKNIRENNYSTYYSMLEKNKDNQMNLISLLSKRPGEFARRLDMLLRHKSFDIEYTLQEFGKIADQVSPNVLLQLYTFFQNRNLYSSRIFCIKKLYYNRYVEVDDNRNDIPDDIIERVCSVICDVLSRIYSSYPRIENVYLDESMKNYAMPMNTRNKSKGNKTLTFGTRIKLDEEDGSFIRFFTHWKNMKDGNDKRVDIDLSVELINEDFTSTRSVSWHDLYGGRKFDTYHSGDIVTAPKGASEFIDLDYIKASKYFRYGVICNYVYTGQDFCDIPECFSGVMFMEKKGKKGVVFNPEFVKYKYDLTQYGSSQNIALAIDFKNRELIWMDIPRPSGGIYQVASGDGMLVIALKEALKKQMNMYDFIKLHSSHVTFVDDISQSEFIISDKENATLKPYDVEKVTASWL